MRPLLFWLHRWCGILLSAYVLVISLSGAALVFHDEIAEMVRVPKVEPTTRPFVDADAVVGSLESSFPEWHLQTLWWPMTAESPWFAEIRKGAVGAIGETALAVYLDPHTGAVLDTHDYGRSAWRWLQLLHFNLLSGRTGRTVNGVLAASTLLVLITGIAIWFPRDRQARLVWRVRKAGTARRFAWELHQVTGLYVLPFFVAACLTGSYFAWRVPVHQAINQVFPMRFMNQAIAPISPAPAPPFKTLTSFLPEIRKRIPGYPVTRVIFPEQPNLPIRFIVYEGSPRDFFLASNLFFDPASGELLRADLVRDRLSGDSIVSWIGAVHYGAFGSWVSKTVWLTFGGIGIPTMVVSGAWLYLKKTRDAGLLR